MTIHNAGIKTGATLVANFNSISITVKLDGSPFNVEVDPDNLVKTIQDAIKEKKQVEAVRYTLKMNNVVLDNTKTIYASGIKAGSVLTADLNSIKIKVDVDGKIVEVNVDPNDKVKVIKDKIKATENIEGTGYKLVHAGVTLDDTKTIYASGIVKDATVVVNFNSITISVKLGTKTFNIDVDPDNKVKTIRDAIKEK
jgi:aerobic-type carbon monoxide dehydrogenase small subunit (CoxS/CutS family)